MARLIRGGDALAPAEVARTRGARRRGLIGRDGIAGVFVIEPCRQVHTFGMRFDLDVAWCDRQGRVLRTASLPPARVSRLVLRSRFVVEAPAGALARWNIRPGDMLRVDGGDDHG